MDPDGDGDPSDGVDGWRLDAAEQVPHGFWKRWVQVVKSVDPEALILGEIWTNPRDWLGGDEFDVVTNYRLARAVVRFCRPGTERYTATRFAAQLDALARQFNRQRSLAMGNLLGSHDTDRLVSMMANPRRRYDSDNLPGEGDPPYNGNRPGESAYARQRLAAVLQFTLPGAPMIYNGDEVGMYGGEDPYCRAPMWWPELGDVSSAGYRADLLDHYRGLVSLRKSLIPLRRGSFQVIHADDARRLVAFARTAGDQRVMVVVNGGLDDQRITLTIGGANQPVRVVAEGGSGAGVLPGPACHALGPGGEIGFECPGLGWRVLTLATQFSNPQ
jgi:glycosidase